MIRISKFLVPNGYVGITLFPFIFLKDKKYETARIVNHERIHLEQQKELLIIFFYLWYVIEFLFLYSQYRDWNKAYRNISFEREAYDNENNIHYLSDRKRYSFFKYKVW